MKEKKLSPAKEKKAISPKEENPISMEVERLVPMKAKVSDITARIFHSALFSSALLLLVIIFTGTSIYLYAQMDEKTSGKTGVGAENIVARVGELIFLPTDEEPTLATVSDPEKLKSQPFFTKAQTGDHVLIYSKAGKAVLYRSSTNQIIEVGPIRGGN